MGIEVTALDHVTLNVTGLARAKRFYGELLGLDEIPRPESYTFAGAWYRAGTAVIHLVVASTAETESTRHVCLWVEDVNEARRTLQDAGLEVLPDFPKIPGLDRFYTHDPDGNRIEFQGSDGTTWTA